MKNFKTKAFTLVEMLIVIVIIGILIAALLPRLQGAQGMARDTSRKTGISQIQSAIVAYQVQFGKWPEQDSARSGTGTDGLLALVTRGIMNSLPEDPNLSNSFVAFNTTPVTGGAYGYLVGSKSGTPNAGFALMAKTETPGHSNWAVQSGANTLA